MKIGLIIYGTLDQVSGGYLFDRMLTNHLRKSGATIEIISLPLGTYWRHLTDNFSVSLLRDLKAREIDLFLQDELNHPSLFYLNRRVRKTLNRPIIGIVHHLRSSEARPAWENSLYRRTEKLYLETLDGFICNSETTRDTVKDVLGRDLPSVVARPGGDHLACRLSVEQIARRCREPGPLKILFTGNVIRRKGLHTLLAALDRLPREGWRLTVAGSLSADAPYVRRIRQLISQTGCEDKVILLDAVPTQRLAELMESHHCLAIPSFYEGFGIAYLEAMGFGEAVIASPAGAIPEIIDSGKEGFLVSPGDCAGLAESIGRLIRDRDLLLAMSLAARKRYQAHPTWAESMSRAEDFLNEMIRRNP